MVLVCCLVCLLLLCFALLEHFCCFCCFVCFFVFFFVTHPNNFLLFLFLLFFLPISLSFPFLPSLFSLNKKKSKGPFPRQGASSAVLGEKTAVIGSSEVCIFGGHDDSLRTLFLLYFTIKLFYYIVSIICFF